MTSSSDIDASTYPEGSFIVTNTGETSISSVTFDFETGTLQDMVFDPNGTAGDTVAKDLQVDSEGGTGFGGHTFSSPHEGDPDDGYDAVTLTYDDFDPGEEMTFSVDADPTSIKGLEERDPKDPGAVSGLEVTGAEVTAVFADG